MEKLLRWNPEFAKNIWLELSPMRLIALPAILVLLAIFAGLESDSSEDTWNTIHIGALVILIIVGMLWGIKTASESILDEYNEKTWDWQKMSLIGPWRLVLGKLFGSTIYNWYGALICWVLFMLSAQWSDDPSQEYKIGIALLIGMVAIHGLVILMALQSIRKADGRGKIKSSRVFIGGILLMLAMGQLLGLRAVTESGASEYRGWYGLVSDVWWMVILCLSFYTAWIVAGLYRSMRVELQYRDSPTWWLAFILSNPVFQYGFFIFQENFSIWEGIAALLTSQFVQCLLVVYFLALVEAKDIVQLRSLLRDLGKRKWAAFLRMAPLWLITLPLALLFGLLAAILLTLLEGSGHAGGWVDDFPEHGLHMYILYWLAILGFVIRDLGVLLLLHFSRRSRRADVTMLIYLLLVYGLFPGMFHEVGASMIFYPNPDPSSNIWLTALIPLAEAALVVYFLHRRWQVLNETQPH